MNLSVERGYKKEESWIPHHHGNMLLIKSSNDTKHYVEYRDESSLTKLIYKVLEEENSVSFTSMLEAVKFHGYKYFEDTFTKKRDNDINYWLKQDGDKEDMASMIREDCRQSLSVFYELCINNDIEKSEKMFHQLDTAVRELVYEIVRLSYVTIPDSVKK